MTEFPGQRQASRAQAAIRRIAIIAMLAILLGLVMQLFIIIARLAGGGTLPGITVLADLVQSVTWSLFVCTGVAIGVSISKTREALAGLMAAIFAPLGLAVAKGGHKATLALLDAMEQPVLIPLLTTGTLRAVQYGLLAWILAILTEKEVARPLPYLGTGLLIGIVFGGGLVALTQNAAMASGTGLSIAQLAGMLVNEIGSPAGCALVIFIGQIVPGHFKTYQAHQTAKAPGIPGQKSGNAQS